MNLRNYLASLLIIISTLPPDENIAGREQRPRKKEPPREADH